ncbi:flagellar hook-associated protein FlgK [Methylotenera sp. N17]|uniref:flagellar hook-associated protein FlgK n=1 Tax=Methylotenera sp. N17 TaxID=1502761 RepID=UPI000646FDE3|nr:flagellar hook-associated protein FlgK [Methylotenera sp. N17]
MASNILSIGKSALNAAQIGLSTTGHNIANASTPGYSRQIVVQAAAQAQNFGYGFIGQGAEVTGVTRVYNEILARQMISLQSTSAAYTTYGNQLNAIDNMLSDEASGLNPAMNDFFASVQALASKPNDIPTRQTMLSNAQSLASRLNSMDSRLNEIEQGVNNQLVSSVNLVNNYAKQIASLNDIIEQSISTTGNVPNDLMDQRDQLISELSKQIKTTVVQQNQGTYNVFIGNGLPLVVGEDTYNLVTTTSPTDPSRIEVGYQSASKVTVLGASNLSGGAIGGLIQFRSESLDQVQNQIGQIAVALAGAFNTQHAQGLDRNGDPGGILFNIPVPVATSSSANTSNGELSAQIVDPSLVTSSDYRVQYDGSNYKITRLSDQTSQTFASLPLTIDGLTISQASGTNNAGDDFLIRPTANAAATMSLAITDVNKLAVGSPVLNPTLGVGNTGTGAISAAKVDGTYASSPLSTALNFTYTSGLPSTLTLAPSTLPVTVTYGGVSTTYPAGAPITYTSGATISVAGTSFAISGAPANGDQFNIAPGTSTGSADNRNGLLLAGLQTAGNVAMTGSTSKNTFTTAFSQAVSSVGNKTRELKVTGEAETKALAQATAAMQSESGVNLDEEATNLIRYQQAYQAAGKMMQIASDLFDVLLQIG